jgi:hypothetical protein
VSQINKRRQIIYLKEANQSEGRAIAGFLARQNVPTNIPAIVMSLTF